MEKLQLWGDSPVRWLTTTIFHTAANVTISLTAPTYSSMQMGHGELRRWFKRGRVGAIEKEIEIVRNIVGVTKEKSKEDTSAIVSLL